VIQDPSIPAPQSGAPPENVSATHTEESIGAAAPAPKGGLASAAEAVRDGVLGTLGSLIDFVLRLKLRLKLSLLVGASIAAVTVTISTIALDIQERELKLQTEILGTNLVQSLSAVAEDNLLLSTAVVLQDYIKNFGKRNIPGLMDLFVVDRNGTVVAHWIPENIGRRISQDEWRTLSSIDTVTIFETQAVYRFVEPVFVTKRNGNSEQRILIGLTSASFSKGVLLYPLIETRQRIIVTGIVVAMLAIGLVYLISRRLVHVVMKLSTAARRVGSGDLSVSVSTPLRDEVGSLAREFNLMVAQMREKTLMQKYVSQATMEMIAEKKEATLGGTRRVVTAMFTDIRNFSALTEERWPEEVVETLNEYLTLQTPIIHDHGGMVDKYIGDGIMCLFSGPQMVDNAVKAAIEIQRAFNVFNADRKKKNAVILTVGIGIATGRAVIGSVGSPDRMDHTAIGDTINFAARLCNTADSFQIFINEVAKARLNSSFRVVEGGALPIKGRQIKIPYYQVTYTFLP
jgi:class 3 adenylate cyclase